MEPSETGDITGLLRAWSRGNHSALNRLTARLYAELRRIAKRQMNNEQSDHTLQTTALVNEVYIRLVDLGRVDCKHRAQFFALSAQIMRHILIDAARARCSHKRGGGAARVSLDKACVLTPERDASLLALNDALEALSQLAPRQAKVVELRYFGGMSEEETAEVMRTSVRTVGRDYQFARAWLMHQLSGRQGE